MTTFVESPWPAVALCAVLLFVFGTLFVRTGRVWALAVMAAAVAGLVGLVVLERAIVTETEEVEDTLYGIAEDLEANDTTRVLDSFAPNCPRIGQTRSALSRVTVQSATVGRDLEVRINKLTSPPTATAYFTGRLQVRDNSGTIPYENYIRKFKIKLERHADRWLIADFDDGDLRRRNP